MDRSLTQRGVMAGLGAIAGLCLYLLSEVVAQNLLPDRLALGLTSFGAVFFFVLLALAGPLHPIRAALCALGSGGLVAALLVLASLRFNTVEALFSSPTPVLAAMVLATVPLPFVIAAVTGNWRDYAVLFNESWGIVVRYAAAGLFTGVVWALILLSDNLFGIVGMTIIADLLAYDPVPWVITGAVLGLALAVVIELSDLVSPYLVLRLLRLLLPLVLLVMAVFVVALPVQGLSGLFGGLSVAAVLLAMVAAGATLVTVAVDQNQSEAVQGRWMPLAARAVAVLMPVFGALAAWSVWLRVDQYGWTPARLFACLVALAALGYGALYLAAVLARGSWMARIRASNVFMALVIVAMAMAWLSVLNPQSISAQDQMQRFESGKLTVAQLDVAAFHDWGNAGAAALASLQVLSQDAGQEALAEKLLRAATAAPASAIADSRAALAKTLAVVPADQVAMRDQIVADMPDWVVAALLPNCQRSFADGTPACILAVADFWLDAAGQEAILLSKFEDGGLRLDGFALDGQTMAYHGVNFAALKGPTPAEAEIMIRSLAKGGLDMRAVPRQSLRVGRFDLMILP